MFVSQQIYHIRTWPVCVCAFSIAFSNYSSCTIVENPRNREKELKIKCNFVLVLWIGKDEKIRPIVTELWKYNTSFLCHPLFVVVDGKCRLSPTPTSHSILEYFNDCSIYFELNMSRICWLFKTLCRLSVCSYGGSDKFAEKLSAIYKIWHTAKRTVY